MGVLRRIAGGIKGAFRLTGVGLSTGQKLRVALPGPVLSIGGVLIHNVFIKFYTDVIGLAPEYVGWVYVIYNIWNAVNDPLLGAWIDRMRGKPGQSKYVYLMRVTVPFMMLSAFMMALSSPSWSQWAIFLVYTAELFVYDTAATAYSIAYSAYTMSVAPTKEERTDLSIMNNYISQALSAAITMIPTLLLVGGGRREVIVPVFTAVIAVETAFFLLALKWLPKAAEAEPSPSEMGRNRGEMFREALQIIRSRPFLSYVCYSIVALGPVRFYFTPYLYFMDHVLKTDGGTATVVDLATHIAALLCLPLMGRIAKSLGTKRSVYFSAIPALLGFGGLLFANSVWSTALSYVMVVFTVNYLSTATAPVGGLIIDEDEHRTGIRKVGLINGLFALFVTAFSGLQTVVFTSIIGAFGYDGGAVQQTVRAVQGIRVATGLVPLLCLFVGMLPMALYPFDKWEEERISRFSEGARRGAKRGG